ncbi:MAG: 2-amino-4-hydroxy-6-hydroxymethyldihydropteridine diphosphokinase [Clostridia bacterium]|nr:MAG: 2-amino-4-hydroxy-6-hydroxymethyldihydropteridine diphosphokinase [Clostridia bacterium]
MADPENLAYISIGSNLGDRAENCRRAMAAIQDHSLQVTKASRLYLTEPVGGIEQPWFANQVVEVRTTLAPRELLARLLAVEHEMGRVRQERWGPRIIDLDLLLYGDRVVQEPDLILPHPRLGERAFVLVPLAEIVPEVKLPNGVSAKNHLHNNQFSEKVLPWPAEDGIIQTDGITFA